MRRSLLLLATFGLLASLATVQSPAGRHDRAHTRVPSVAPAPPDAPVPHPPAAFVHPLPIPQAKPAPARGRSHDRGLARSGMVIAVDPETGQLRQPEPAGDVARSIDDLQALARDEARGLATLRNADGSETLNHEGRFTDHSVIRAGPGGAPLFQCVHGSAGVRQALEPARPRPAFEEE